MNSVLTINDVTCGGCGNPKSSSTGCNCHRRQTLNMKPEPIPYTDWEMAFNQDASQKQSTPQAVLVNNQPNKPNSHSCLGLPQYDYDNNFYTGR